MQDTAVVMCTLSTISSLSYLLFSWAVVYKLATSVNQCIFIMLFSDDWLDYSLLLLRC